MYVLTQRANTMVDGGVKTGVLYEMKEEDVGLKAVFVLSSSVRTIVLVLLSKFGRVGEWMKPARALHLVSYKVVGGCAYR